MAGFMKDPRVDAASDVPFDGERMMIFGGFTPAVSLPA